MSKNNHALVTVIIPTFNRGSRVLKAIDSVLAQRYPAVQLIVVDDGSTDNTRELLAGRTELTYIYQSNEGQASARNAGLLHANGEFIASLDSDDYWEPSFLERCVQALEDYQLDFVFANWYQAHKSGKWSDFLSSDPFLRPYITDNAWVLLGNEALRTVYLEACPSPSSSAVIRRSAMFNKWDKNLNIGDDWCLYLDMVLNRPCRAAFTLEKLWYKDIDGSNIYDGRQRSDVVRLLLVNDTKTVIERYRYLLSAKELSVLKRRYIAGLVELAKHTLVRERRLLESWCLFREAVQLQPAAALSEIPKLFYTAVDNHMLNRNR